MPRLRMAGRKLIRRKRDVSHTQDEKICRLKPIVVLQRLSVEEISSHMKRKPVIVQESPTRVETQNNLCKETFIGDKKNRGINFNTSTSREKVMDCFKDMQHVSGKHPKRLIEKTASAEERPYQCSECEERFHTSILLAVHKRIHERELEDEECQDEDHLSRETSSRLGMITSLLSGSPGLALSAGTDSCTEDDVRVSALAHGLIKVNSRVGMITSSLSGSPGLATSADTEPCTEDDVRGSVRVPARTHRLIKLSSRPSSNSCKDRRNSGPADPRSSRWNGNNTTLAFRPYLCLQCPARFSQQWYLTLHLILLHIRNGDKPVTCPGCHSVREKEKQLRTHVLQKHSLDVEVMNTEISTSLGIPTSALTGERSLMMEDVERVSLNKKNVSPNFPAKPNGLDDVVFDQKMQRTTQKGTYLDVVEKELRLTALERLRMGDTLVTTDIQRLAIEISHSFSVFPFVNGYPSKIWARKILTGLESELETGKIDHINSVYIKSVSELSSQGLIESNIFYVCEGGLCTVDKNRNIVRFTKPSKENETRVVGSTLSVVVSANATGTVLLDPTLVLRGQILNYKKPNQVDLSTPYHNSSNLIENDYFREWFFHFVSAIPPARPVLLLIEGHVSQIPYHIIPMARANDVHIAFVPSRKRFLHPHQMIRAALLAPLRQCFERKACKVGKVFRIQAFSLNMFYQIFEPAWKSAVQEYGISKSFLEAGFVPLSEVLNSQNNLNANTLDAANVKVISLSKKCTAMRPSEKFGGTNISDDALYQCPLCKMNFSERELQKHVCMTKECELYLCQYCGMSFALKDTLEFHLAKHKNLQSVIQQQSISPRQCSQNIQNQTTDPCKQMSANLMVKDVECVNAKTIRIKKNIFESSTQSDPKIILEKLENLFGLPCSYAGSLGSFSTSSTSALRSETLTASSSDMQTEFIWNDSEVEIKTEELNHDCGPCQYQRPPLPRPPLPEHDYLGQIYHTWNQPHFSA